MSICKLILEFNKQDFSRISDFLERHYFHLVYDRKDKLGYSKYYLGSGSRAQVYASEKHPDIVLRITEFNSEYNDYKKLLNKNFDYVVDVKFHRKVSFGVITAMEKLDPLSNDLKADINKVKRITRDNFMDTHKSHEVYEVLSDNEFVFKKVINLIKQFYTDRQTIIKYFTDVFTGMKELASIGVKHQDMHSGNIMKDPKTGNYKIIDITF